MHEAASDLTGLAIIALAALACGLVMQRLRQPPVIGYILAGAKVMNTPILASSRSTT